MMPTDAGRPPKRDGEPAYLDTNVIISYLLDAPADMAEGARVCFEAAARGDIRLLVTPTTLAEAVWVLGAAYHKQRTDIADLMLEFMTAEGIDSQNRDEVTLALSLYKERNVDFADALLAARCLLAAPPVIYSFDRHFDRIPGVERRVPGARSEEHA
jgi:predicted nucleic-acid-binding protein